MDSQNNLNNPIAYCLYARKSSESDERQAMSIDSQIKEMKVLAEKDKILIKEIRYESHSAKQSGQRPVFKELIADIMLGEFSGILTWHPDRLSRNAGDLGMLVDLMDQGKLQQIRTYSQVFHNSPNDKFLLMILCSQAKLENDNKGINVKRGIRAKCELGWRPGPSPLGYMNRSFGGKKDIIIDPERAPIIKEGFEKVAYMYHSGWMLKEWMDKQGFTTKNGKRITQSMIYLMLRNPFYYGYFEFPLKSGKIYKGAHEPIITKEVFDDTQKELEGGHKKLKATKDFAFKGIFKCYSCGSGICGEEKLRKLKNGGHRRHVYYHCTRSRDCHCKEPYIDEKELIKIFSKFIDHLDEQSIVVPANLLGTMNDYRKIVKDTLFFNTNKLEDYIEVTIKDYAKYIVKEGTLKAKRDLVINLNLPGRLHNRELVR